MLEGQNVTFEWRYTLDGTNWLVLFRSITGGARSIIATNVPGFTYVEANFQKRFTVDISVTQAKITMLAVQMSEDRRKFEFEIVTSNSSDILDEVELIVQCK